MRNRLTWWGAAFLLVGLWIAAGSVLAAACYEPQGVYVCTSVGGGTCYSWAARTVLTTNVSAPGSCPYVVVLSAAEYNAYQGYAGTLSSQASSIGTLNTDLAGLSSWRPTVDAAIADLQAGTAVLSEPFDYAAAAGIFALFFASVVTLWVVSRSAGLILEAIKRW